MLMVKVMWLHLIAKLGWLHLFIDFSDNICQHLAHVKCDCRFFHDEKLLHPMNFPPTLVHCVCHSVHSTLNVLSFVHFLSPCYVCVGVWVCVGIIYVLNHRFFAKPVYTNVCLSYNSVHKRHSLHLLQSHSCVTVSFLRTSLIQWIHERGFQIKILNSTLLLRDLNQMIFSLDRKFGLLTTF